MFRWVFLALTLSLGFAQSANAIIINVALDPGQSVPLPFLGGATPTGSAIVDVDTTTGAISITGSYSGMTSAVTGAHLHGLAPTGSAAGVLVGFSVTGGTTGTFMGSGMLSDANLSGLLAGLTYINVHTSTNGPGEIRGQVVPEPGTLGLLGAGLIGLAWRKRKAA